MGSRALKNSLWNKKKKPSNAQYIAKNVRHLYGLPPDTNRRSASVHDVYGHYYTYLAEHIRRRPAAKSLLDYAKLINMVSGPLRRASGYYGDPSDGQPREDTALIARLPRGDQSLCADVTVVRSTAVGPGPCGEFSAPRLERDGRGRRAPVDVDHERSKGFITNAAVNK